MFNKICVIGVGLMGGSLALALKEAGMCNSIVGYSRNENSLKTALKLHVIDLYETSLQRAIHYVDMIILAVPVSAYASIFGELVNYVSSDTIITDVGSTKQSVVDAAKSAFGEIPANFVPGHPIAGTEKCGVEAAFAHLYKGCRVILTPSSATSSEALNRVRNLWEKIGAQVVVMTASHHDEVLAATSHMPHVLAYTLVECLSKMHDKTEIFDYAAGGFRDFTRIASSDATMWKDICLANSDAIIEMIDRFDIDLKHLRQAIQNRDDKSIYNTFVNAKRARDRFCG